jgi:uncharacterized protein (DUF697 family)
MHDIDRTLMEYENPYEAEYEADDEYEYEDEYGYDGETDAEAYEMENVFDESEEMELASELMSVADDEELEYFLGNLIKKAGRKIGRFVKSKAGRALGKVLKGVAKKALPIAGGALGTLVGGPAGGAIGSKLAGAAGKIFGLELEGLSPEDQEFEVARRVVRLAGNAAQKAAMAPPTANPAAVAKTAVVSAAKTQAPGLIKPIQPAIKPFMGSGRTGRWVRRGRKIVLLGV